jgi:hypothetical protein
MKTRLSILIRLCLVLAACITHTSALAATIVVVNNDAPGEGFNDPTPFAPVGGNPSTTLGAARLFAFQHAADIWGELLESNVVIEVGAQMNPQFCDPGSAVLGSAGAETVHRDFVGAIETSTWYSQALANSLAGVDLAPGTPDIGATFNSNLNGNPGCLGGTGWYYGIDQNPGGDIDFVTVVMHEIGHGLGFQTFVSLGTGAKFQGFNDTYMLNLEHHFANPSDYASMSNAQRVAASTSDPNLHWIGLFVLSEAPGILTAGISNGHVRAHGPNPQQPGSSVSHWSPALAPNELMEPFYTGPNHDPSLALILMKDIGWRLREQDQCVADGDVDGNAALTPGDALCAFNIFLNGGVLPPSCDFPATDCEIAASDVNCDNNVTPQDGLDIFNRWLNNAGGPSECFAQAMVAASAPRAEQPAEALFTLAIDHALETADGVISIPVMMHAVSGAAAFGFELNFDPGALEFEGFQAQEVTRDWNALDANEVEPGRVIAGGFDTTGLDDRDLSGLNAMTKAVQIATVRFRKLTDRPELEPALWRERVIRRETITAQDDDPEEKPLPLPRFDISQPFPNPVRGTSSFVLSVRSEDRPRVTVSIYDVHGRLVTSVYDFDSPDGDVTLSWDRRGIDGGLVSSGIYFVRMEVKSAGFQKTRKLVVFR